MREKCLNRRMIVILHLKDLKVFTPVVVVIANSQSLMI